MISGREKLSGLYEPWRVFVQWVLERADEAGLDPRVTSGRRDRAQQAALYQRYVRSGYNRRYIAARPGRSSHEFGLAVDVWGNDQRQLIALFKKYGAETVSNDPEHFQYPGYSALRG